MLSDSDQSNPFKFHTMVTNNQTIVARIIGVMDPGHMRFAVARVDM